MILKGNVRRKTRLTHGRNPWKEYDLSVDTGHMSHHNVPLPLKPRTALSAKIGEMLTSLDNNKPKQMLRQEAAKVKNKKIDKRRKEAIIKRKKHLLNKKNKQHESKRPNELLKQRVKANQVSNALQ